MRESLRRAALGAAAVAICLGVTQPGQAQEAAPSSIELVVPNSPGGSADTIARMLQQSLVQSGLTTAPSVVLNKPGGGGNVTLSYVDQHPGDNGVVAITSITHQLNYIVGTSEYTYTDFTPLAMLVDDSVGFAVQADSPLQTAQDLVDALRADPQSVSIAITAIGGLNHIPALQLARAIGIDGRALKTPVFDSSGDSTTALMGGHVDVVIGSAASLLGYAESGLIRILAVTSAERIEGMNDVPTWTELGYDVVFNSWRGIWGPKDLTPEQIAFWDRVIAAAGETPEWQEQLANNAWGDGIKNAAETRAVLDDLQVELVALLTELGIAQTN